jgi:rubrerythrin
MANLNDVLELAIQSEIYAREFYLSLREKVSESEAKDTLEFLAAEEEKHQAFLERYRRGEIAEGAVSNNEPIDYKIAEHFEEPQPADEMKSEEVFLIAAHREKLSHEFYLALAELHPDGEVKEMLKSMAEQELGHKEKAEYLYSNTAFPQTAGG